MKFGLSDITYNKILEVIKKNDKYIFKMFGSRARGDYKANSDIDIVVINCIEEKEKNRIKDEIDLLDIPYSIDLVFIEEITKKELLNSIERDGVIIW